MTKEEAAELERKKHDEAFRAAIENSQIPARYKQATIKTCVPQAEQYAQELIAGGTRNMIIAGAANTGKTYMACATVREVLKNREKLCVRFTTMADILQEIKSSFGSRQRESEIVDKYAYVSLLVIDDLGKENPTQWSLPIIWQIVDKRYSGLRPTIYTSQYNRETLSRKFTEGGADAEMAQAIMRRILQNGEALMVKAVNPGA